VFVRGAEEGERESKSSYVISQPKQNARATGDTVHVLVTATAV
jgi:hypothetical protein